MSQRKGLADVFEAVRLLDRGDVELVVMGTPILPLGFYRQRFPNFVHEGPRPHAGVLKLMRTCDVLVLPSIVEGRALVIQEAMSQGLPVIITSNTGSADLVDDGHSGFLIPIRRPDLLAGVLARLADDKEQLTEMRIAATRKAALYTWAAYTTKIFESLPFASANRD